MIGFEQDSSRAHMIQQPTPIDAAGFAALLFPFVVESGLSLRSLVDGTGRRLLRFTALRLAGGFRRSFAVAQIGG
jgi:hypothetical protein